MSDSLNVQHSDMVRALVKPGHKVLEDLTPNKADMIHAIMGISGEVGELMDAVKKAVIYNKPLDRVNMVEELGDIEFYMEQLRQRVGITRDETLQANIDKLAVRYEGFKYTDRAAQERADKKPVTRIGYNFAEENCPGHTGRDDNLKVCIYCGVHVDEMRPGEDDTP